MARKRDKFRPYIRRMSGNEKGSTIRQVVRLTYYQTRMKQGKPAYVLVQRGFHNLAMDVGPSREALKKSILIVGAGKMSFKQWQTQIHRMCNKAKP